MRRTGLRSILKFMENLLGKIGIKYVNTTLYERSVESEVPVFNSEIPADVTLASKDDVKKLFKKKDKAIQRLENGDLCFIAVYRNRLIAHFWLCLKESIYIPEIERTFNYGPNAAFHYDAWVCHEYRNYNVAKKGLEKILNYLKSTSVKKSYTTAENIAAKKVLSQFHFKPIKNITYLRIFMFKKYKEVDLG